MKYLFMTDLKFSHKIPQEKLYFFILFDGRAIKLLQEFSQKLKHILRYARSSSLHAIIHEYSLCRHLLWRGGYHI